MRPSLRATQPASAATAQAGPEMEPLPREVELARREDRFGDPGRSLRSMAARGTIINSAFLIGLNLLSMVKGFVIAGILTTSDYGLWGVLAAGLGSLTFLLQVGINDKYIQQDEENQEQAFQRAFTLQCIVCGLFTLFLVAAVPVVALGYGQPEVVAAGLVLAAAVPAYALQSPLWIFIRRMLFLKQRTLQAISPVVGAVVTVGLAIAGFGYWSLVIGITAGGWAAALASVLASPYRLRFRFNRQSARAYLSFSWPVFISGMSIIFVVQVPVLVATHELGLAAVGAIALANLIPTYARQASDVVTQTMYPAICAVKDRADLMFESFSKSNRIGILWGAPVGAGVALFASDLVHFVLGGHWEIAVGLLQAMGIVTVMNQIGYNWSAFYRAIGNTRPLAVSSLMGVGAICGIATPLLAIDGLRGFGFGMIVATGVMLAVRFYYLSKLFPALSITRHATRALAPTLPAVLAVLTLRMLLGGNDTLGVAIGEFLLFSGLVVAVTTLLERSLMREMVGYLRNRVYVQPSTT